MRTNLEFRSVELSDPASDESTPHGATVARLLHDQLSLHGFAVHAMFAEDWGWHVSIANDDFPLWIGCGRYEEWDDGLLCFIEPHKPSVRRWLRRVSTADTVERLATAIETIVRESGKARDLRWWTDTKDARG